MLKKESQNVLDFIKQKGVVRHSSLWKEFSKTENCREGIEIDWIIDDLAVNGYVKYEMGVDGDVIIKDTSITLH